jgi:hypothetical protein
MGLAWRVSCASPPARVRARALRRAGVLRLAVAWREWGASPPAHVRGRAVRRVGVWRIAVAWRVSCASPPAERGPPPALPAAARRTAAMTIAALLAALAGLCAAAAIVEFAGAPRPGKRVRTQKPRGGHLGGMTILLARLARRPGARAAPPDIDAKIAAAGAPLGLTAPDVMALKGAGALIGGLLALPLVTALPGRLGLVALL